MAISNAVCAMTVQVDGNRLHRKAFGNTRTTRWDGSDAEDATAIVAMKVSVPPMLIAMGRQKAADSIRVDDPGKPGRFDETVKGAIKRHPVDGLRERGLDVGVAHRTPAAFEHVRNCAAGLGDAQPAFAQYRQQACDWDLGFFR